jgi:hypothetical protein
MSKIKLTRYELWNESLNSDGQQSHKYQQNEQSPLTSIHQIWKKETMTSEDCKSINNDKYIFSLYMNCLIFTLILFHAMEVIIFSPYTWTASFLL